MRLRVRFGAAGTVLCSLVVLVGCRGAAIENLGCVSPPAVEDALRIAMALGDRCARDEACWERALAEARALRDRFPGELGAHRAYVLSRSRGLHGEYRASGLAVAEEYRELLARRPDDPGLLYLNGLLAESRTDRRELLRQSIARADDFPWPRYALALELGWRSDAAARAEGERFVAACPDRLSEIERLASALDDTALFDRYRERFTEAFRPEQGRFTELATLWQQSFQFAKPDRHAGIRSEIATSVAATAALERGADRAWLRALEIGYRLTGDSAGASRAEELVLLHLPCEPQAMAIRDRRFRISQPKPEPGSASFDDWRRAQLATVDALLESCPASGFLRMRELNALAELDVVPAERFVEAGMALAAAQDIHAWPSNPAAVAKRFLEYRVGIEKVASLLEQDREEMELEQERALLSVIDDEDRTRVRVEGRLRCAGLLALRSELALRESRAAEAERLLTKVAAAIDSIASEANDDLQKQMVAAARAERWRLSAGLAEERADPAAALAAYGQAIVSAPPTAAIRKAAATAFIRFYGSAQEFPNWVAGADRAREAALTTGAAQTREAVPEFRWFDLTGRQWTRADLRGKVVLLNFWATWCGPCVAEMPYLMKLSKRFRDDPRVLIVGVSVDESPGPVQPFVERLGCDYPILLGGAAVWSDWRLAAIPKNLILDPSGGIVSSDVAFGSDGDRWVAAMSARLLEAAGGSIPGRS